MKQNKHKPVGVNGDVDLHITLANEKLFVGHVKKAIENNNGLRTRRHVIQQVDDLLRPLMRDAYTSEEYDKNAKKEYMRDFVSTKSRYLMTEAYLDDLVGLIVYSVHPQTNNKPTTNDEALRGAVEEINDALASYEAKCNYFNKLVRCVTSAVLYNSCGLRKEWVSSHNILLAVDGGKQPGGIQTTDLCMLNTFWSDDVDIEDAHDKAELFGEIRIFSKHSLWTASELNEIYLTKEQKQRLRYPDTADKELSNDNSKAFFHTEYYQAPLNPRLNDRVARNKAHEVQQAFRRFRDSAVDDPTTLPVDDKIEVIHGYAWINEDDYLGGDLKAYRLYEYKILEDELILFQPVVTTSTMPIRMTALSTKSSKESGLSPIEKLLPLQEVINSTVSLLNTEIKKMTSRKIVVDPSVVPIENIVESDRNSTNIVQSVKGSAQGQRLVQATKELGEPVNLGGVIQSMGTLKDMLQELVPSINGRELAGLDRSTQFQTAAVMLSQDNRVRVILKLIAYNILSASKNLDLELLYTRGGLMNAEFLLTTPINKLYTEPLNGLDRLAEYISVKDIFMPLLQSGDPSVDILKVVELLANKGGFTDFNIEDYRKEQVAPDVTGEQQQQPIVGE